MNDERIESDEEDSNLARDDSDFEAWTNAWKDILRWKSIAVAGNDERVSHRKTILLYLGFAFLS